MEAIKKILLAIVYLFAFIGFVAVVNTKTAIASYEIVRLTLEHKDTKEITKAIHIRGDFDDNLTRDVKTALEVNPEIDLVALDSPGGNANEAFALANLFSEEEIRVWVPKGRICLSACAIAFTGGYDYNVQGVLGFHNAYIPESEEDITYSALVGGYISGQQLGSYATGFFVSNGFSFNLQYDITSNTNPSDFLAFTSTEDFEKYYVRNDEDSTKDTISNYWQEPHTDLKIWNEELTEYRNKQIEELDASGGTYNIIAVDNLFTNNPAK